MGKYKLLTTFLIAIILILCVAIYYTQRQVNIMRIAYNRSDRELALLKDDYALLYNSYYQYNEKLKLMVLMGEHARFSSDSSAFLLQHDSIAMFAFTNKPTMKTDFYLWGAVAQQDSNTYQLLNRVDTLKPHQYIIIHKVNHYTYYFIAPTNAEKVQQPKMDTMDEKLIIK